MKKIIGITIIFLLIFLGSIVFGQGLTETQRDSLVQEAVDLNHKTVVDSSGFKKALEDYQKGIQLLQQYNDIIDKVKASLFDKRAVLDGEILKLNKAKK